MTATDPGYAHDFPTEPCPSCSAPVIWAISKNLRPMPIDPVPVAGGNVQLVAGPGPTPHAKVLNAAQQFGKAGTLRTSHHMTCPRPVRRRR